MLAGTNGYTSCENEVVAKPKHAQAAMDRQSPTALSHGCGQQSSIGSETDIPAVSVDLSFSPAPAAAGSIATDAAIKRANMVRAMRMDALAGRISWRAWLSVK